jgi:Uma2 family endonuclease
MQSAASIQLIPMTSTALIMNLMSTRSAEYREAVEHLPPGAILVFPKVTWEQYENILEDLANHPGLRVSYDEGRLEIVSRLSEHEDYKDFILRVAHILSEELDTPLEPRGSTTWKRRKLRKGAEPDTCFYVTNAYRIIGKRKIDLESDPPPDIVVEIDTTNESMNKFSIYAALGVPEIWHYNGKRVQMYEWTPALTYAEISASRFFPPLTGSMLAEALESSKTAGHTEALKQFRRRLRTR